MLRRSAKAAIFDRREHEAKAKILGEQRHRLVHRIRRMILRSRGGNDPAIIENWEEHTELDHVPLLVIVVVPACFLWSARCGQYTRHRDGSHKRTVRGP